MRLGTADMMNAGQIRREQTHLCLHGVKRYQAKLSKIGGPIVTVKELPGHANISVTMRYAHSNDETKRRAIERLGRQ